MSFRLARLFSATLLTLSASSALLAATPPGQTLIWRGDITSARGVMIDAAKTWQKTGKGKIELQPFNTASGIDAVVKGTADIAGSARDSNGGAEASLTFTPVAWDALVMITNPSNPVSNMTMKQLHDIYYGKITNWKELGGKDEAINVYAVASPADGVEFSLRRLLFGRGNQPVAAPRLYVNVAKLEEGVTLDRNGLGATTLAGVRDNKKVKMISIDGVAPSLATISSGSYALYTPIYLVTREDGPKAEQTKAFLELATSSQSDSLLRSHGLLPYAAGASLAANDTSRRKLIASTVGTRANVGQPMSAPGATASALAASAPTSARTLDAKQALAARKGGPVKPGSKAAAAKSGVNAGVATTAAEQSPFAKVTSSAMTSARAGFVGIRAEAITVPDQAKRSGKFAKVTGDAIVMRGKPAVVKAAPANTSEKPARQIDVAPKPAAKARTAAVEPKAKAPVAAKSYKVAPGDTLYSIAHKNAVDVAQVRKWNGLKNDNVRLGQVLKLSASR
jgi:phosphate transport system substrate-binding protein